MKRSLFFAFLFLFMGVAVCQAAVNEADATAIAVSDADARSTATSRADADVYNRNSNIQGQGQLQGQLQGQIANGAVSTTTSIDGDDSRFFAAPAQSVPQGNNGVNAYSPFGGIGVTETDEYKTQIEVSSTIDSAHRAGYLAKEEAAAMIALQIDNMMYSVQPKRLLGIGPQTSGRHLLNLFGTLSWNSFWKAEQKPFHRQK